MYELVCYIYTKQMSVRVCYLRILQNVFIQADDDIVPRCDAVTATARNTAERVAVGRNPTHRLRLRQPPNPAIILNTNHHRHSNASRWKLHNIDAGGPCCYEED